MKMTTLERVLLALETMEYVIIVPKEIREKARQALDDMLAVS